MKEFMKKYLTKKNMLAALVAFLVFCVVSGTSLGL